MTTTLAAYTPGTPPISTPRPPPGAHQVVRADLRREPAGDLAHRRQQRQRAVGQLDRLVRDAGDLAVEQRVGALLGRGQVQVREQHLALAHPVVLLGDRLLDLEDQLAGGPDVVGRRQDRGARGDELLVRDRRAVAGARPRRRPRARCDTNSCTPDGRDRHPVLVVLDLAGDANLHSSITSSRSSRSERGSCPDPSAGRRRCHPGRRWSPTAECRSASDPAGSVRGYPALDSPDSLSVLVYPEGNQANAGPSRLPPTPKVGGHDGAHTSQRPHGPAGGGGPVLARSYTTGFQLPPHEAEHPYSTGYAPQPTHGLPGAGVPTGFYVPLDPATGQPYSEKSRVVAGVLSIVLGSFGAGRYTGHIRIAIAQLAVTWLTCGIGHLWPLIDGIIVLSKGGTDSDGRVLRP